MQQCYNVIYEYVVNMYISEIIVENTYLFAVMANTRVVSKPRLLAQYMMLIQNTLKYIILLSYISFSLIHV